MVHYTKANLVDHWERVSWLAPLDGNGNTSPWNDAEVLRAEPSLEAEPEAGARFAELPSAATRAKSWTRWSKMLATHAYRAQRLQLWQSKKPKLSSNVGESEAEFRGRLRSLVREARDLGIEKLRRKYAPKLARIQAQVTRAEQKVEVEEQQYKEKRFSTVVSIGTTVLGALFGRKAGSVSSAGTALRRGNQASRQKSDIGRAEERVELLQERLDDLEARFQEDLAPLQEAVEADALACQMREIALRKSDLEIEKLQLVWLPQRAIIA